VLGSAQEDKGKGMKTDKPGRCLTPPTTAGGAPGTRTISYPGVGQRVGGGSCQTSPISMNHEDTIGGRGDRRTAPITGSQLISTKVRSLTRKAPLRLVRDLLDREKKSLEKKSRYDTIRRGQKKRGEKEGKRALGTS